MNNQIVPLNLTTLKSIDELINMYKQGYTIDITSGNIIHPNGSTVHTMTTVEDISTLGLGILSIMIGSLIYYKVGKWEAKKLGWDK